MKHLHAVSAAAATTIAISLLMAAPAAAATTSTGQTCTIRGTAGADTLRGTSRNDVICGMGGRDTIQGVGGTDVIDGGPGIDKLYGGDGTDTLLGGSGGDTLAGGAGIDTVSYADHRSAVVADLDGVRDDGAASERDLIATSTESLIGGAASDRLTGSSVTNVLTGGGGNDTLTGGSGNDPLIGGTGADKLVGGDGNDTLTGGAGGDTLLGNAGRDTVAYSEHATAVAADLDGVRDDGSSSEGDLIATTVEALLGGSGNDLLTGSAAADTLNGGGGADTLNGGGGNDALYGGSADDVLYGEGGDDGLTGGPGADTLDGGVGVNPCHTDRLDVATIETCEDVTAPWIVSWSVSPAKVDTRYSDQQVSVTVRVVDDLTSSNWFILSWQSPRGFATATNCIYDPSRGYSQCGSGAEGTSPLDQTFTYVIDLPRYSHLGTWTFPHIEVVDAVGNARTYSASVAPISAQPNFYNGG